MNQRTRSILEDLETVRENLLALSDDIWHSIDHNNAQALEEGVEFKRKYNERLTAFDALASEISELVQQFTSVNLQAEEQSGAEDEAENVRIIQQLNREVPHSIDEDFYAECNLSANGIRDVISRLLTVLEIPKEQLQLFLREDRDAERENHG